MMLTELNQLTDYIEAHLTEALTTQELARQIGLSEYHLKRTFSFIAGISLGEYIRHRRLSCANHELIQGAKVTDVAFLYGYQSVEGFSRAFREWSGYLPSEVYKTKQQKVVPKLSFSIQIKGGISMNIQIEHKPAFQLVGVSKTVPIQFEGQNEHIIALAQSITPSQREHMHQVGNLYPYQVVNASYQFDATRLSEQGTLQHMIGFLTSEDEIADDLESLAVGEQTWAIFTNQGSFPQTLQDTWARIFSEWLPTTNYELVDAPEISFTKHTDNPDNTYSEIWIAVKEK